MRPLSSSGLSVSWSSNRKLIELTCVCAFTRLSASCARTGRATAKSSAAATRPRSIRTVASQPEASRQTATGHATAEPPPKGVIQLEAWAQARARDGGLRLEQLQWHLEVHEQA